MSRYLVVAHQTAAGEPLIAKLKELAAREEGSEFTLVVPATPVDHLLVWEEGESREIARRKALDGRDAMVAAGLKVRDAVVGDASPLAAIEAEIRRSGPYDALVISTFPLGVSRWLRRDLPRRAGVKFGLPVIHVVSPRKAAAGAAPAAASVPEESAFEWDLQTLAAWLGKPVVCADGREAGHVSAILYDSATGEPSWIEIGSGLLRARVLLAPASRASPDDGRLRLAYTYDTLHGQPHADIGAGFVSLIEEQKVHEYFGLPFREVCDLRVLRHGDPIPGKHQYSGFPR
jgi:hypothetical protein